ncbi:MAG: amino acid ABC transporter substrate-binding protein, partial [Hyphomicrobiales bacterium]
MHIRSTLGATLALLLLTQSPSAEETITLGAALSLTGKYSTDGEDTKNGYDLAVKTINAAGGVLVGEQSHDIVIKYYDDESSPQRGADLVERLISQDGIQYILGPFSPEMISAVAPIIEKYKVPMLLGNSATQSLFTAGNQYIFTVLTSVQKYLSSALKMATDRAGQSGGKLADMKVAAAFESDLFSQAVRAGVLKSVEDLGMQVVIDDKFPAEFDDMAATLKKVKTMKPDILVVSGHASGAATAIRQIAEMKVDVPMLALTHCDDANIIKKFGDLAAYTLCASQWTPTVSYRDDIFGSA